MKYREGYKYQLAEDEAFQTAIYPALAIEHPFFRILPSGLVIAKAGYAWDGSTGAADTRESQSASLLHDVICQAVQIGLLDKQWKPAGDREYYRLCVKNGMWRIRAAMRYLAISIYPWDRSKPQEAIEVP